MGGEWSQYKDKGAPICVVRCCASCETSADLVELAGTHVEGVEVTIHTPSYHGGAYYVYTRHTVLELAGKKKR
jgi:hypothetical protein